MIYEKERIYLSNKNKDIRELKNLLFIEDFKPHNPSLAGFFNKKVIPIVLKALEIDNERFFEFMKSKSFNFRTQPCFIGGKNPSIFFITQDERGFIIAYYPGPIVTIYDSEDLALFIEFLKSGRFNYG